MSGVVRAVMKMIVHIEAVSAETVATVEERAQVFLAETREQYDSIGRTEWSGMYLKIYLNLPFPVLEPARTTITVDNAVDLISKMKKAEMVVTGQVETEYAAYDPAAFSG